MIKKITLFLCITAICVKVQSQETTMIALYSKQLYKPLMDTAKVDPGISDVLENLEREIKQSMSELEYQLLFTKTESLFSCIDRLGLENDNKLKMAEMSGDGDGIRYSNLATNESLVQKESFDKLFLITVDACNQKWEMKNESRKIGPFNCFKATTNKITRNSSGTFKKTVVAWYTTELPFPFGPIGYGRLPGLIVELTYENVVYCLKKIDLSPKTKLKIVKPFKGKHVSETEYEQWEQEAGKSITIDSFR